jgi:hypothetical protein
MSSGLITQTKKTRSADLVLIFYPLTQDYEV